MWWQVNKCINWGTDIDFSFKKLAPSQQWPCSVKLQEPESAILNIKQFSHHAENTMCELELGHKEWHWLAFRGHNSSNQSLRPILVAPSGQALEFWKLAHRGVWRSWTCLSQTAIIFSVNVWPTLWFFSQKNSLHQVISLISPPLFGWRYSCIRMGLVSQTMFEFHVLLITAKTLVWVA